MTGFVIKSFKNMVGIRYAGSIINPVNVFDVSLVKDTNQIEPRLARIRVGLRSVPVFFLKQLLQRKFTVI